MKKRWFLTSCTTFNRLQLSQGSHVKETLVIFSFGGLKILHNNSPVTGLASRKAHALLVYLAVAGLHRSRDHLADLFWEERSQSQARANLRVLLSSLNKQLGSFFQIEQESVALIDDGRIYLDTADYLRSIEQRELDKAVELYRGSFLQGFNIRGAGGFDHWVISENERYHQHALEALQALVDRSLRCRHYQEGIRYARKLLSLNPLVESAHRNLMRMLALSGHRDQALEQYKLCAEVLAKELAVSPSSETETLHQQIVAGVFSLQYPGFESGMDLPAKLTPFVGRIGDLEELERLLCDEACRMLTIVGPGGMGKSRLAIEVTKRILDLFPDGVFYLSLVGLDSAQSLYPTIADALKLKLGEAVDTAFWIKNYLRDKRCLLLFDNFEHVLAGKQVVEEILATAPFVKALITSRQKLSIDGEIVYWLEGLSLPPIDKNQPLSRYDASKLFLARAYSGSRSPKDALADANHIARICHLVEGVPLGIEMAAAWVDVLPPPGIVEQLESGLGLLQADADTLPDRQRSFKVVFEHTWDLLSSDEQAVALALSVFRGGFDLEAAEQVAGAGMDILRSLVNKSLVHTVGGGRFRIHELLRQSAAEKLEAFPKEMERIQALHRNHYLSLLNRWDEDLKSARQSEVMALIEIDLGNIQKAWVYAVDSEAIDAIELGLDGICRYYRWRRRHVEGVETCVVTIDNFRSMLEKGIDNSHIQHLLARTLIWESHFHRPEEAIARIETAQMILDNLDSEHSGYLHTKAFLLHRLANLTAECNPRDAIKLFEQSLMVFEQLDATWEIGKTLTALGWVYSHLGEYDQAAKFGEKSLSIMRILDEPRGLADAIWLAGSIAIVEHKLGLADELISECLEIREQVGERITDITSEKQDIGMTLTWLGKVQEAQEVREETLKIYQERGLNERLPNAHIRLAFSQLHTGEWEGAWTNVKHAFELAMEISDKRMIGLANFLMGCLDFLNGDSNLAEQYLEKSVEVLSNIQEAGELGWAYTNLALVKLYQGAKEEFGRLMLMAFESGEGFLATPTAWMIANAYGSYLIREGRIEYAAELNIFFSQFPLVTASAAFMGLGGRLIQGRYDSLTSEQLNRARERGLRRELMPTMAEIRSNLEKEYVLQPEES